MMFVENHMQDFFSFIYMYLHLLPFEPLMNEEHDVVQKKVCQRKPFFFHNSKDLNLAVLHEKSVKWWGKRRVSFLLPISLLLFFVYMYKYLSIYSKRRIKKAFLWNEKYKIKLWKWIHILWKRKKKKKEVKFKNSISFLSDRSAAEYCRWTNCHGMVPILWYKQDDQLFIL